MAYLVCCFPWVPFHPLALLKKLIEGYQFALSFLGLESYIISAPRESLLSANREGIFSCIGTFTREDGLFTPLTVGFTSIFFVGCQLGRQLVFSHGPSQKSEILARKQALRMLLLSVLLYCTVLVLEYLGFRSSRRLVTADPFVHF